MDFLDYLLLPLVALCLLGALASLLITWFWPGLYANRLVAWALLPRPSVGNASTVPGTDACC